MTIDEVPIFYMPDFVREPDKVFNVLQKGLLWERRDGAPRSEYYCNDTNVPYTYGHKDYARTYYPRPYTEEILDLRMGAEYLAKTNYDLPKVVFDVCFLNRYHDSSDQLGWHSDDSPEMDDERPIAIVTLGAERDISFKKIGALNSEQVRLKLQHGSICLMAPGMQDTHQHRIPKAGFDCGERISLTFRGYVKDK